MINKRNVACLHCFNYKVGSMKKIKTVNNKESINLQIKNKNKTTQRGKITCLFRKNTKHC